MSLGYYASAHVEAAPPTGGFGDDFNRANSSSLGANYVIGLGGDPSQEFGILDNQVYFPVDWADLWTDYAIETDTTNCFNQIWHNSTGDQVRLKICGGVGRNAGYILHRHPFFFGVVTLFREGVQAAEFNGPNNTDPATWRIEHNGTGLVGIYRDAALLGTWQDPTPLTGKILGFGGKGGNNQPGEPRLDDWLAGDL